MRTTAIAAALLVLTAGIAPTAVGQSSSEAYAGTHVSFDASSNAVTDYSVHGEELLGSVRVQSQESAESSGLLGADVSLSAVTSLEGAGLDLGTTTKTHATVKAESGATMTAHDNGHGILVVSSSDQSNYVVANLSSSASAEAESDSQVGVTTANGTQGSFIVVGEGNVTVNDDGDVSAQLGDDGKLIFRSYPEGKDDADETQEQFIANGTSKAEAYVMTEGEQTVVDTVSYGQNTTVETETTTEDEVTVTVDRATSEGTVVVTSVSEQALNATENLSVTVEGEAAAQASSYSELKGALGSDESRYVVQNEASAAASTDVLVAVNHFSEKDITMSSGSEGASDGDDSDDSDSDADTDDGDESGSSTGSIPGFGVTVSVVALVGAALLARMR